LLEEVERDIGGGAEVCQIQLSNDPLIRLPLGRSAVSCANFVHGGAGRRSDVQSLLVGRVYSAAANSGGVSI
jgi:hypothetical protein